METLNLKSAKAQQDFIAENLTLLAIAPTNEQLKSPEYRATAIAEIQAKLEEIKAESESNSDDEPETPKKVVLRKLEHINYKTIDVQTKQGVVEVEVAMIPFEKLSLRKAYTTKDGKHVPANFEFQFRYATGTVKSNSAPLMLLFEEDYGSNIAEFNKAFKGREFPIKLPLRETNNENHYRSEIIEAGVEELIQKREDLETLNMQAVLDAKKKAKETEVQKAEVAKKLEKFNAIEDPEIKKATAIALGQAIAQSIAMDF